jgi:hypothetical protein
MLTLFSEAPASNQINSTDLTERETMIITEQSGKNYSANSLRVNILTGQLLDRLLFFIKPIAEYAFGMHIGFAFGWLIGLCAGYFYVNHFEPLYFNDINELAFWTAAPQLFARYGAITGLVIGILAIQIINDKLLNQGIIELCEKQITNPAQIARFLDSTLNKIERKMTKLAGKRKISPKIHSI